MLYYVKFRGKVLGPFEENQVRDMVRQGKLGRMSEISRDGQKWTRAGDEEAFFPKTSKTISPPAPRRFPNVSKTNIQENNSSDGLTLVPPELNVSDASPQNAISQSADNNADDENSNAAIWYYSEDGTTGVGPFSQNDLARLLRQGKINGKTIVWCDNDDNSDSSDPTAAENTPEFASLFQFANDATTSATSWQSAALSNKRGTEKTNTASSQDVPAQNNALSPIILNPLERLAIWVFIIALGAATLLALSVMSQLFWVVTLCKFSTLY
ncbi:MAG: DUF4339 domain-containing protein [Planctomycetaceae bacterium]|nr:DUF4339 domain-containing protein [Planctomycetaceae bacterium]